MTEVTKESLGNGQFLIRQGAPNAYKVVVARCFDAETAEILIEALKAHKPGSSPSSESIKVPSMTSMKPLKAPKLPRIEKLPIHMLRPAARRGQKKAVASRKKGLK